MKISLSQLSTSTLGQLVSRVLEISAKAVYKMVANNRLLLQLIAVFDNYMAVFDKKLYSGYGEKVALADLLRDNLFKGFKEQLMGLSRMEGLSTQQDAIDLYGILEVYGVNLYNMSYGDESIHLDGLIKELEKPENLAKVERVHMTESLALLKSGQQNFESLFDVQNAENAELRGQESSSSLQNKLVDALRNYLNYVEMMYVNDPDQWKALYDEINEQLKSSKGSTVSSKTETKVAATATT